LPAPGTGFGIGVQHHHPRRRRVGLIGFLGDGNFIRAEGALQGRASSFRGWMERDSPLVVQGQCRRAITCLQSAFGQFGPAQCFSGPMKKFDYRLGSVVRLASVFELFVKLTQHLLKSHKVPSVAAVLYGLRLKAKLLYAVSKSRWRHS
jgi:hypothetical protein